tara:strand:+ start:2502 stop:2696 length:195 start_codon:yes stop_codon:yes gene_type:complete
MIISFNICLLIFLIIGLQNSSNKHKIDFIFDETIELPVGFIFGSSFILGSVTVSLLIFDKDKKS